MKDPLATQRPNFCDMMQFSSPVPDPLLSGHWNRLLGGNVLDLGLQDRARSA